MSSVFRLEDVSKRFGHLWALDHVSLNGPKGTVVALLGENGAGKTTALKILLGLLEADGGLAQVYGLNSRHYGEEIRRRVGYVSERPTLYDWMTVGEIGWFASGFYDATYLPRYKMLVEQFALPSDRKIKALSKGMRAKVALSLAIAHEPELLILDEPTSGLDPLVRREFLQSMIDVAASGRTVLLSSHQLGEVERVADIVAILRKGKLQIVERLEDLKQDVREITVTLNNGTALPELTCEVISRQQQERQYRLLVRRLDDSHVESLRASDNVGNLEVTAPSLEEIFVSYMRDTETP